jgi:hypothetical protein
LHFTLNIPPPTGVATAILSLLWLARRLLLLLRAGGGRRPSALPSTRRARWWHTRTLCSLALELVNVNISMLCSMCLCVRERDRRSQHAQRKIFEGKSAPLDCCVLPPSLQP